MRERELGRLERHLVLLGRATITPPTPDIAGAVERRLQETTPRRRAPTWAVAGAGIATALILLSVLVGTVAPAREAIADLFDRINIFEVTEVPPGTPTDIDGDPVTLVQADQALGFEILLPDANASSPTKVLLQDYGLVKAVAIFFERPDTGSFVIFETDAAAGKGLTPIASAEPVEGFEDEAYWLRGLRIAQYEDTDGSVVEESVRATETNTLLWIQDGHVFRLEGNLSLEDAVIIAKSLR
jgi:hypothetical protein